MRLVAEVQQLTDLGATVELRQALLNLSRLIHRNHNICGVNRLVFFSINSCFTSYIRTIF